MLRSSFRAGSLHLRSEVLHGRKYEFPQRPVVVVCIDGCEDDYLTTAMAFGCIPNLQRFFESGFRGLARSALPSFTNINNAGIITGLSPKGHGISGNYFYDSNNGHEVTMNSQSFLRADTILKMAQDAGRKVAVVTAKDKLLSLLSKGLSPQQSKFFSVEFGNRATIDRNGLSAEEVHQLYYDANTELQPEMPCIYSAAASIYVVKAGATMVEKGHSDFLYLSTTDYIQHKHEPSDPVALNFYSALDFEIGRLTRAGCVVGVTADHGMNSKQKEDGSPNVLYLCDLLNDFGVSFSHQRVVLPITDPYVRHHGSLGGFASIYLHESYHVHDKLADLRGKLLRTPGMSECYSRQEAALKLELPEDRVGDLTVLANRQTVLGKTEKDHELHEVRTGLRSHGSRYEEMVPFLLSHPLKPGYAQRARTDLRNFDIFEATMTWTNH